MYTTDNDSGYFAYKVLCKSIKGDKKVHASTSSYVILGNNLTIRVFALKNLHIR